MKPILVVEDDADTRELMVELLQGAGFPVHAAPDGRKALDHLLTGAKNEPSLIVLDLAMPGMTGWEFLGIVRNYLRLAAIPVILISGSKPEADAVKRHRISGVFEKPVDPDGLLARVREVLQVT